jgi:hypothetical protein
LTLLLLGNNNKNKKKKNPHLNYITRGGTTCL